MTTTPQEEAPNAPPGALTGLTRQFVRSFQKAVRTEMSALREQSGPYEVPVSAPGEGTAEADGRHRLYEVTAEAASDKLILNGECTLVHDGGETLVTLAAIDRDRLTLRCEAELPSGTDWKLVIYPWFLYERLLLALESLPDSPDFHAASALALFGKLPPRRDRTADYTDGPDLNASQRRAVQLCSDSSVAFVWGPPGTGKTRTISHIVTHLLAQGQRVLLTSTTNAAIDQALAVLATHLSAEADMRAGRIVRVGQTNAETFGASLGDVVKRQNTALREELDELRRRAKPLTGRILDSDKALRKLESAASGQQLDMFVRASDGALHRGDLAGLFRYRLATHVLAQGPERKRTLLARRRQRLQRANTLYQARIGACLDRLAGDEKTVMAGARVVLATMTNMYISKLLKDEPFDVVIVEEAGMAILPTLFYCAGLAARKVIAVGDPRQLPPIVLSRDPYVMQAMGRNIFDVTVPAAGDSEQVVMLDTQYRMHPAIGALVSGLFYDGRLVNDRSTACREAIAARHPYPGQPLVVVDTQGATRCTRAEGGFSRSNPQTAEACVRLAGEAVADGIESVAIITPYAQQSRLISTLLARSAIPEGLVECRTVHRFQGNERDLVILDTVDTAPERPGVLLAGRVGASAAPNLLNVSLSRARGKLVIISDVAYFRAQAAGSAIDQVLAAASRAGWTASLSDDS